MAYSKHIYDLATKKLGDRRASALSVADYRKNETYREIPRLSEIEKELSSIGVSTAKAVLSGKDAATLLTSLKEKSVALQKEFNELLLSHGYSVDYLEPQFSCDKCSDTGFIEFENKTITCECYKKLLSDCACKELNSISPLSLSTFDSFKLALYSDKPDKKGNIPYVRMQKIYDFCLKYATEFTPESKGIMMKGDTGLGKTHLSLAIANEVIKKGYSVVYVSAPDILSKLEKEHFTYSYSQEQEIMQSLINCDLLILDDLGTEFATNFTKSAVYNIFNTRVNMGKPIIINTNYTSKELEENYTQRFVSRVMASCSVLSFIGTDIRSIL